jgi:uncharacterized tellurite resistance protein B-like protein
MDKVVQEIRTFEKAGDPNELGRYLTKLVKNDQNASRYEGEFAKHLHSDNWYLKKTAVFALLFALQIDKKKYRDVAIESIKNPDEDEEVRRWSATGLGETYQKTKDKELLKLLIDLMDAPEDEFGLRTTFLSAALLIFGITTRDQFLRKPSVSTSIDRMKELFQDEIKLMKQEIS